MPCLTKPALATQLRFIVESPTFFTPYQQITPSFSPSGQRFIDAASSTHHQRAPVRAEAGKSLIYLILAMPAPVRSTRDTSVCLPQVDRWED